MNDPEELILVVFPFFLPPSKVPKVIKVAVSSLATQPREAIHFMGLKTVTTNTKFLDSFTNRAQSRH